MKDICNKVTSDFQAIKVNGNCIDSLIPELSEANLKKFFELTILSRAFNQRALSLQREGRIRTYASFRGQEATQVGSAMALENCDWIFPSFRNPAVLIARDYPIHLLFNYYAGDERSMQSSHEMNIFPLCVPMGTHLTIATGTAWAIKLKKDNKIVAAYFGDGASSKGDFHEALNLAGVFKLPIIFICENNQWATSLPRSLQTAGKTIAERAFSYGFEGIQVDGNDIIAVYKATKEAVDKAREGAGPTLIECVTYRLDDHTTSDNANRYRSKQEVEYREAKEPLIRLRHLLEKHGLWSRDYENNITDMAFEKVDEAIKAAESLEKPKPADILLFTNHKITPRQEKELMELGWG